MFCLILVGFDVVWCGMVLYLFMVYLGDMLVSALLESVIMAFLRHGICVIRKVQSLNFGMMVML